jgi:hypothetical protein
MIDTTINPLADAAAALRPAGQWASLGEQHRAADQANGPWPHLALDDLFDPALVAGAEHIELAYGLTLPEHRSDRQVKAESPEVSGAVARKLHPELMSPRFVRFVSALTGIPDLLTDPADLWGGLHVAGPGAFQAVHRDFRKLPGTGLFHRANALLYLNADWREEYGGSLELSAEDLSSSVMRIAPRAGRLTVFESRPTFLHGIPYPVTCPPGQARLALAAPYYSRNPPPDDRPEPLLRRPRRPTDPVSVGFAGAPDALMVARRQVRRLATRLPTLGTTEPRSTQEQR